MSKFQYSLNASTIRTTPILKQIAVAGRCGYAGIELWHDAIDNYVLSGGTLRDIKSALDEWGLAVPTTIYLGGWFDALPSEYETVRDECRRRIEVAAELGAPHIIAGPASSVADLQLGAERYGELLEIGAAVGVYPSMEFLGFVDQLNTIEAAMDVMARSGNVRATTVLDPFHIFRGGGSMESISFLRGSQVAVSHFNDAPSAPARHVQHDADRVMPGDGQLDLPRYLSLLAHIGYSGFLSLELFRPDLWADDPVEVARIGLAKMKQIAEP